MTEFISAWFSIVCAFAAGGICGMAVMWAYARGQVRYMIDDEAIRKWNP